ncbi:ABC-type glycerol-3-phosphate transport system substrate-binding protein [Hamadaea flava]|uniref:ABC transporter substrate-binding protein n=1 Tax=Hamadaea flava TaxID=1742688 RepID=A0ABV8LQ80_9ACTN|nr:extracellular solute-binding protein [Hamadaea flava]MCP2323000.1 ABC-type glycerol-3-phosphate transport system substrate-binding protein [Hamadaea flava]
MRTTRRSALALFGGAAVAALTGCDSLKPTSDGTGDTIVLRVQGMPPATEKASLDQFAKLVADFEKANPGIKIEGSTNVWDSMTFSAKLAGGSIEDVISVPLTEPQGLIERKQVSSITGDLRGWNHYQEFNPQVLKPISDAAGEVYGVPEAPFALGLVYNRALFAQAGLDPDKPPTTWADVQAYAKQIAAKTGKPGYVQESKDNQGGWQLTMITYAHGGSMERLDNGKYVADFNSAPTKSALNLLKTMRWTDDSLGRNLLNNQNDVIKAFAAGQVGMFLGTPGTYRLAKVTYGMTNTGDYGIGAMPQAGGNATLSGGKIYMVPASVSAAKRAAAVKWLLFAYAQPQYDPAVAAANAKALAADPKAAVGVPTLPLFNQAQQDKITAAIQPYVNVELPHFAPYLTGTPALALRAEPAVQAQAIYAALDTAIQAVLTDRNADVDALLAKAESDVNAKLAAAQK